MIRDCELPELLENRAERLDGVEFCEKESFA